MISYSDYLEQNKEILLSIFGQLRSAKSLEMAINHNLNEESVEQECCLDAVLLLKYNTGIVNFPIAKPKKIKKEDNELATDFYSIVLCEGGVQSGILIRDGIQYIPKLGVKIIEPQKFGKYLNADL